MESMLKNPVLDSYPETRKSMERFLQKYPGPGQYVTHDQLEQKRTLTELLSMLIEVNDPKHWENYESWFKKTNALPDAIPTHSTLN